MKVKNCLEAEMERALAIVNKRYAGNVIFGKLDWSGNGKGADFSLKVKDIAAPGCRVYRRFGNVKRSRHACYHVHGDFFDALFSVCPEAIVISCGKKITKDGGNWKQCGMCAEDSCDCSRPEHKIEFGTLTPEGKVINVRTLSQETIKKCPRFLFDPDHYKADGTCLCFDKDVQAKKKAERLERRAQVLTAQAKRAIAGLKSGKINEDDPRQDR